MGLEENLQEMDTNVLLFFFLLHNKLSQNFVPENNDHQLLSHSFFGSGILEQLCWAVLTQGLSQSCSQMLAGGLSSEG